MKDFNIISSITAPQIRKITEYIGNKVHSTLKENAEKTYDNIIELSQKDYTIISGTTMVIEFDGSMIRHLVEKGTEWKELKLGCIFIKNQIGRVIQKEYISYSGTAEEFKKILFHLAVEMKYMQMERIQIIADGAHWIWNICKELFPNAIEVLDYYHCKENVFEYYNEVYRDDKEKATNEANKIMKKIEREVKIETILKQIPELEIIPQGIVNLKSYLDYHKDRIKYKTIKKLKLDIGSGVIESGNKNVIQHRMKQTGMQWKGENVNAIASLRCKNFSFKWEDVKNEIHKLFSVPQYA